MDFRSTPEKVIVVCCVTLQVSILASFYAGVLVFGVLLLVAWIPVMSAAFVAWTNLGITDKWAAEGRTTSANVRDRRTVALQTSRGVSRRRCVDLAFTSGKYLICKNNYEVAPALFEAQHVDVKYLMDGPRLVKLGAIDYQKQDKAYARGIFQATAALLAVTAGIFWSVCAYKLCSDQNQHAVWVLCSLWIALSWGLAAVLGALVYARCTVCIELLYETDVVVVSAEDTAADLDKQDAALLAGGVVI